MYSQLRYMGVVNTLLFFEVGEAMSITSGNVAKAATTRGMNRLGWLARA
jgi:hypothetical protein